MEKNYSCHLLSSSVKTKQLMIIRSFNQLNDQRKKSIECLFYSRIALKTIGKDNTNNEQKGLKNHTNINSYHLCPLCDCKTFVADNKILCVNECFEFQFSRNQFNNDKGLEKQIKEYINLIKAHQECNSCIKSLLFDNKTFFYCEKCFINDLVIELNALQQIDHFK